MNNTTFLSRGFTLVELMVVISIVSFLASTIFALTGTARVSAHDKASALQTREIQKAIALGVNNQSDLPYPGPDYYCLGRSTCVFGGQQFGSSPSLDTTLGSYINMSSVQAPDSRVYIEGLEYSRTPVFKCIEEDGTETTCKKGIVYYAQHGDCPFGAIQTGTPGNGVLCRQDAGGTDATYVEPEEQFDLSSVVITAEPPFAPFTTFSITYSNNGDDSSLWTDFPGQQIIQPQVRVNGDGQNVNDNVSVSGTPSPMLIKGFTTVKLCKGSSMDECTNTVVLQ